MSDNASTVNPLAVAEARVKQLTAEVERWKARASRRPGLRRVIVESPFGADSPAEVERNRAYARAAMLDCLLRGEAPMASHLLYTQVLDDGVPAEREQGLEAGLAWGPVADATVAYLDRGISNGMRVGIARATREGRPVEYRCLEVDQ